MKRFSKGLGTDCTTIPGFTTMYPEPCPGGGSPYVQAMVDGCPIYECVANQYTYGATGVTFDPNSVLATVGAAQSVLDTLNSGGNVSVVGASTPQEAIQIVSTALTNVPSGSASYTPLNASPTVVTNSVPVTTQNTTNGTTNITKPVVVTPVETISLFSGEPMFTVGNFQIGVYTALGVMGIAGVLVMNMGNRR